MTNRAYRGNAIIKTLLYFDVFHYPLTQEEIVKFMQYPDQEDIGTDLHVLEIQGKITQKEGFYFIGNDDSVVERRKKGNQLAEKYLKVAQKHSKWLSFFPFIHAACISGSLSKHYMDEQADIDYFLITKKNRIWLTRICLALVIKTFRFLQSEKFLCLNYFISENNLEIKDKDIYTAIEIATIIPTYNYQAYLDFVNANDWVKQYFPNWQPKAEQGAPAKKRSSFWKLPIFDYLDAFFCKQLINRYNRKFWPLSHLGLTANALRFNRDQFKMHTKDHKSRILDLYQQNIKDFELKHTVSLNSINEKQVQNKILFTHSYFLNLDPKQEKAGNAYPPLQTLYAAALMRENGYTVSLFDSMLANSPFDLIAHLKEHKPHYLVIFDDGFNYLTKMCLTNMRQAAFNMIKLGKEYGCKILISSSDSTDHYQEYLDEGADYVLLGESEITLLDLMEKLKKNEDLSDLAGIAYQQNNKTIHQGKRAVMRELDHLPFAAWDLVEMNAYRDLWMQKQGYFSLNLVTSRGCTYKCNWCAKPLWGNRYHARTPEHVVQELEILVQQYGVEHIWFCDDIFGLKPGWLEHFAELIQEKNLQISFKIQSRADLLNQVSSVKALADAGCETVWLGAESGSQRILDAMEKGITIEQVKEARQLLKLHGIRTAFFLQFGYLGETEEDIEATFEMVRELMPDDIGVSVTYPLPGTKLYEKVKADLTQKANWSDSDDLAMMFRNTYSETYYKNLQRHIHQVFRREKSKQALLKLFQSPQQTTLRSAKQALLTFYHIPMAHVSGIYLEKYKKTAHVSLI